MNILNQDKIIVRQRRELVELFGFETRNKYEICDKDKNTIGFCAEQNKGIFGFLFRQLLGHWRSFELHFFNAQKVFEFKSIHPFRFFFQEFTVVNNQNQKLGRIVQRFGILTKKFDVRDAQDNHILTMRSGFFSFWTFPIKSAETGHEVASIQKKRSGFFKELFLDADNFLIDFKQNHLTEDHKKIILAASVFTDLQYFERKAE
jgi:hypothetical protein